MTTTKVIEAFALSYVDNVEEISLDELKKKLTDIYKQVSKGKKVKIVKEEKPEKKKREPTPYNLFLQEKMAELKEKEPTLTAHEKMSRISDLWKEHKEALEQKPEEKADI